MKADRTDKINPFIVMDVLERCKELERTGVEVIHLEVGEPDFETPSVINEAGMDALREGKTQYTHSLGILELREAIADDYRKRYGVDVSPDQIIITSGTSPAMLLTFSALLNPGEKVILSDPGYACYPNFINFVDGIPDFVAVNEDEGFQFDPERVADRIDTKTKAILINSPSNPTGNLLSPDRMKRLAQLSPFIISDEIYHGLVYGEKEHSIFEFTDRAFVLNGFSKRYAMTGWRLGYVIAPREFIRPMQKMQQNFFISAGDFVQWAGVAALTRAEDDVIRMRDTYNERRTYIIPKLREMGFGITTDPQGAFYVLANAKRFSEDSYKFAFEILEGSHVGVTPGIDFGKNAEGYIRFCYANSLENIVLAMDRLRSFLDTYPAG
ncbi:MAG: pyridoxal phosphate-dependent aminotransferase [Deltaproteobacteria bacterium]|nr:pyridoxal phosphate-dependent aminotransferase [Candidatus Zymogenaceae bacterium]